MELKDVRSAIDALDDQLVALYCRRLQLMQSVADGKARSGAAIYDAVREKEVLYRLTKGLSDEYKTYVKELYSAIFTTCRARQSALLARTSPTAERLRAIKAQGQPQFPVSASVACQGVLGANSYQAADKLFPICEITYFKTFDGVCNAVSKGLCEYGVLPIENSTAGSVNEVYDLMKKYDFYIVKSVRMQINHCLAALPGVTKAEITKVVSHPQALEQCSVYLKQWGVTTALGENTATAAKELALSGDRTRAVLCSEACAALYGLTVLDTAVQNSASNYTRFICIGKQLQVFAGSNKISVMMGLSHEPGSLNGTLAQFAALGLNLTKIESRPMRDKPFEFMFYFDFEGSIFDDRIIALIAGLETGSGNFTLLGSYHEV